jgi:hypothetical protein
MEIVAIEKRTFECLKQAFENFAHQVAELCESKQQQGEWLNSEEVCELLKISKRTLQTYRDTGTIAFSQIGRKCYYRQTDVKLFIDKQINNKNNEKNRQAF